MAEITKYLHNLKDWISSDPDSITSKDVVNKIDQFIQEINEANWDEDHALDLVMNDMISDMSSDDIDFILESNSQNIPPVEDLKEANAAYKSQIKSDSNKSI